jgi:hypothetical protein
VTKALAAKQPRRHDENDELDDDHESPDEYCARTVNRTPWQESGGIETLAPKQMLFCNQEKTSPARSG